MTERIGQGEEAPADTAARRAAWAARDRDLDKPPMTIEELWEVLRSKGTVTDVDVPADRRQPPRRP